MPENLQKFLFLGVLVLSVLWSSRFQAVSNSQSVSLHKNFHFSTSPASEESNVNASLIQAPLLVLSPPASSEKPLIDRSNNSSSIISLLKDEIQNSSAVSRTELDGQSVLNIGEQTLLRPENTILSPVFSKINEDSPPSIAAQIALVADLKSKDDYFAVGSDKRWPLASLTKLVTAVVFMKNKNSNSAVITLTSENFLGVNEEQLDYLKIGDRYSAADLLRILLLASRNEAAEALAVSRGRDKFIGEMNDLVREWGLTATHFADPSGLSAANQSTAEDLKNLALKIYENYPEIFKITRQSSAKVNELNSQKKYTVSNINTFAGRPGFLGGKTGYTDDALGNLLSVFSYEKHPILIVVLGSDDRFGDTEKLISWFENSYR